MVERARELGRRAERDFASAVAEAESLLAGDGADDPLVVAICERIRALAAVRSGAVADAEARIERAVSAATGLGDDGVLGAAHLTAMSVAASVGRVEEALRHADLAAPLLPSEMQIRLDIQRATVLYAANRTGEALDAFERLHAAHPTLGGAEGGILRMNLGSLLVRLDRLAEGSAHLRVARGLFESVGDADHALACAIHAARAAARAGDHATVFELHGELGSATDASVFAPRTLGDLADCLLAAGLVDEARSRLGEALAALGDTVSELLVRTELSLVATLRRAHDPDVALLAQRALDHALLLDDPALVAQATIELAACDDTLVDSSALADAVAACRSAGLVADAVEGEIVMLSRFVRNAVARGADDIEPAELVGSPVRRAQAHHQRALLALVRGDSGRARASLARGLTEIDRARSRVGADELRASASDRAPAMAALGLAAALAVGRPAVVLGWSERVRAASLRLARPVVDPAAPDPAIEELRHATARRSSSVDELERRVTHRRRSVRADGVAERVVSTDDVRATVGPDRALLEYVEHDDRMFVVAVRSGRTTMTELSVDVQELAGAIGKLLFGLRRMASSTGPATEAASALVERLAGRLDGWLVPEALLDARVIVVPTGVLHRLPWAVLPSLADRAVVVAPSAHVWLRAERTAHVDGDVLVATGPRLPAAAAEAASIAAVWGAGHLVEASGAVFGEALAGASIAHLCCHGRFRTDAPQFSAVELADGPFMVVDLDRLERLPSVVVLSACNVGAVEVRIGDDVLGFPAAMLTRGVRSLVAASLPIEDHAARDYAVAFHRGLAASLPVADAARRARTDVRLRSHAHASAAAAITCFGAG